MMRLKADLHAHTADDPLDQLGYSAEMLIQAAAQLKFDVLAIACHGRVAHTPRLARFAEQRGVLLVPAVELLVSGKHVVVLNPDEQQARATSFEELRALGRRREAIFAPHPFYPTRSCLHDELAKNIDVFDAIEMCSAYLRGYNPNRRAIAFAREKGLPMVGTSDAHALPYVPLTFSWVEVTEKTVEGVVDAIRAGRVEVQSRPRPWVAAPRMAWIVMRESVYALADRLHLGRIAPP